MSLPCKHVFIHVSRPPCKEAASSLSSLVYVKYLANHLTCAEIGISPLKVVGSSKHGKEEDPVVLSTIFLKTSREAAGVTKKDHCYMVAAGLGNYKIQRIIRKSHNLYLYCNLHFTTNFNYSLSHLNSTPTRPPLERLAAKVPPSLFCSPWS